MELGPTKVSNTFGFLTFEDAFEGRCYWYDDGGATSQAQVKEYWEFLGHDFNLTRIFAMIGAAGGWLQFIYSITLCCSSQVRRLRYLQFFLVSIVLTIFQGATLLIFSSDFCAQYACTFGRSAGFSGAACACYFMAGSMYLTMSDYPGDDNHDNSNGTTDAHSDSQPDPYPITDEESAGGGAYVYKTPTSLLDSISEGGTTLPTNYAKNDDDDAEEILPSVNGDASSEAPGDDTATPSGTPSFVEDGHSALGPSPSEINEDPLADVFTDLDAQEEDIVEEEVIEEEEVFEDVVEEYVEEEVHEEPANMMEQGEPTGSRAGPSKPLAAPQAPAETPIGKEERLPQSAEEVADDSSNDPIFE